MPGFELIGKEEIQEITDIFDSGGILFRHSFDNLRNGVYKVREFEEEFAERMGVPYALAVTSGTAALRVALASLGIERGDEVITQAFTFVATAESIIESGAIPVISEVDSTLNMDPDDLANKINSKTKAVIVVHMLGVPAKLKEIRDICSDHSIPLIEDTAWGCGGSYEDVPLGTYGDIGTYSFDFAKTMTTGEGGMLVFKEKKYYELAAAWHDHGHENNPKLPRWEDSRTSSGFNYRMSELQGAVGKAQLRKLDSVVSIQRQNSSRLQTALSSLPIVFRSVPDHAVETCDALVFFTPSSEIALECRNALMDAGFGTKILPEAITWHFAGTWSHMDALVARLEAPLEESFIKSKNLLSVAVALPINLNQADDMPLKVFRALEPVFKKP